MWHSKMIYKLQTVILKTIKHCVKSFYIWGYSGPYFPAFALNTERYFVSLRIQSECGKTLARITPNTDTFHAVKSPRISNKFKKFQSLRNFTQLHWMEKVISKKQNLVLILSNFI